MTKVTLKNVRLAFAQGIFEPVSINGSKPSFQCKAIFEKGGAAEKALLTAEAACAKDKWGEKADKMLKLIRGADDGTVHDGDLKPNWDGFEDHSYANLSGQNRPGIYDRDKTPLAASDGKPYGGCIVNIMCDVWAQDNTYGKKLNTTLLGIQFVRYGDAFAAGAPPAQPDDFDDLGVDPDDEDDDLLG